MRNADLQAVAAGDVDEKAISRLQDAEFSKHQILLTALMRAAAISATAAHAATLTPAYRLLADVQARDKRIVHDMLASPQLGSWAAHCLGRLNGISGGPEDAPPLRTDLGHLAVIASAAALRAGHPFLLDIPLRHGEVTLPTLGTARPGASAAWEWGRACLDDGGGRISSSISTVTIPRGGSGYGEPAVSWSAIPRLSAESAGLAAEFWLDDRDPYLDRYGLARVTVSRHDLLAWQSMFAGAWRILVRRHRALAAMIAKVTRSLVPLAELFPARPTSATAVSAFGAIGLSLPADALAMAEVLVHESHHAILGAVTDFIPLTGPGGERLTYAPWRDDARPAGALLQGTYAHLGVAGFWRRQRHAGSAPERLRASTEFARALSLAAQTAAALGDSGVLTEVGQDFVSAMRGKLAAWQGELLPALARQLAADIELDHRARWRLRHLRPDSRDMRSLARAWLDGVKPRARLPEVRASVERQPLPSAAGNTRSYLLMLRYRDPERFLRWVRHGGSPSGEKLDNRRVDTADRALLCGNYADAAEAYLRRIAVGDDADAWAGLAVARQHTGPAGVAVVLAERPEVAADLHERLRPYGMPGPDRLAAWLADPGEPSCQEPEAL